MNMQEQHEALQQALSKIAEWVYAMPPVAGVVIQVEAINPEYDEDDNPGAPVMHAVSVVQNTCDGEDEEQGTELRRVMAGDLMRLALSLTAERFGGNLAYAYTALQSDFIKVLANAPADVSAATEKSENVVADALRKMQEG